MTDNLKYEDDRVLIRPIGLPRAGKSTWSRRLSMQLGAPIVEPDAIRWALYGQRFWGGGEAMIRPLTRMMIVSLFMAGHRYVIADECGINKAVRHKLDPTPGDLITWRVAYHHLDVPVEECVQRAHDTKLPELVPVIYGMARDWEDLSEEDLLWTVV